MAASRRPSEWPRLERVAAVLAASERPFVVGCSALRRRYGTFVADRFAARRGHLMPQAFFASQFAVLEPPGADENAIVVGIDQPHDRIVDTILFTGRAFRQ